MNFSRPLLTVLICGACLFYGCSYSQQFNVILNDKPHPALDSVTNRYRFETIDLGGKKTDGVDGVHSSIIIKCINGIDVPVDEEQMSALAKTVAVLVRSALKDPGQFEKYTVLFVQKNAGGDKATYVGHEFQLGELK